MMQLCLQAGSNISILPVPSDSDVEKLKKKVQEAFKIQNTQYILKFGSTSLLNPTKTLANYGIKSYDVINIFVIGEKGFSFNSCDQNNKVSSKVGYHSGNTPYPYIIRPGLILRAKCKNNNCIQGIGKLVCINKGFGKFDLGKLVNNSVCPLCNQKTQRVKNLGYYKTKIVFDGQDDQSGEPYDYQDSAKDNNYITFKDGDQNMKKWSFLEITTSQLK